MNRKTSGYTLIELLAVMVIMGIIILIALAGYNGISRGAAPRKAAENIEVALSLARQHAVARNVPVLFLLLDADFNGRPYLAPPGPPEDISKVGPTRGRHYAIFDASNRVYLTGWTELPKGVVFDTTIPTSTDKGRNVLVPTPIPGDDNPDVFYDRGPPLRFMIPFPGSSDTNRLVSLPGIAFKTDGTIRMRGTAVTPLRVNVAEGSATETGVVTIRPSRMKYGVKVSILGSAVVEENPSP